MTDDVSVNRSRLRMKYGIALVVLTVLVYAQVRNHQFINFDDGMYVTKNPHVLKGVSFDNFLWSFSRESVQGSANWHPVMWWSLMLDAEIHGPNAAGFLLTNLIFHTANVLLLFVILDSLTGRVKSSTFVAAMFAIHPLHVESVAWVSERKDVLCVFFGLLVIWFHLRAVRRGLLRWHLLALAAFALSLMSKQMLVTLPCVLLLLDYWPMRRIQLCMAKQAESCGSPAGAFRSFAAAVRQSNISRLLFEKSVFFVVALTFSIVAVWGQSDGAAVGSLEQFPLSARMMNAVVAYALYLKLTFVPTGLAVFYAYPKASMWLESTISAVVLTVITVWAVRIRARQPYVIVGWLWFLGTLVPVIGLIQIGEQRMADRYMYFPMIGLLIAVTWLVANESRRHPLLYRTVCISGYVSVGLFAVLCWKQVGYWRDTMTLFAHATEVAESSLSRTKLGYEYASQGNLTRASNHFHKALMLDPDYAFAHISLGNVYLAEQRFDDAAMHFRRAVELNPDHDEAHYNLGIALSSMGQLEEAIASYHRAIQITPVNAQIHVNLGIAFLMKEQNAEARTEFERALELSPDLPEARFNLGKVLAGEGEIAEAVRNLQKVAERPSTMTSDRLIDVYILLTSLCIESRERSNAVRYFEAARILQPDHPELADLKDRLQNFN